MHGGACGCRQQLKIAAAPRRNRDEIALLVEIELPDDLDDASFLQRIENRLDEHLLENDDPVSAIAVVIHGDDSKCGDAALSVDLDVRLPVQLADQMDVIEGRERERHGIPNR